MKTLPALLVAILPIVAHAGSDRTMGMSLYRGATADAKSGSLLGYADQVEFFKQGANSNPTYNQTLNSYSTISAGCIINNSTEINTDGGGAFGSAFPVENKVNTTSTCNNSGNVQGTINVNNNGSSSTTKNK